jgi:hypothetical protein
MMLQCVSLCMAVLAAAPEKPATTAAPTRRAATTATSTGRAAPRGPVGVFSEAPIGDYDGPVKTIYTPANAPKTPALTDLKETDTISQYGITWKLDKKVRVGQFITGDWYFIGKATVVEITPKPLFGKEVTDDGSGWQLVNAGGVQENKYKDKWARNGSVLNQTVGGLGYGGFDSRLAHGHYDPDQFAHLPIAMQPGDALISTISTPEPLDHNGYGQPVKVGAVLTCLEKPVPADAFRPSYCDRGQKIYLARNLKRELLYTLPKTKSAPASLLPWARAFERPWLDTVNWGYASPKENMPRYGQWITHGVSFTSVILHMDYSAEDKEPLLVHYVQYGVDLWGIVRAGSKGWRGHGGFGQGRKWSIIFAGLMLGDADMQSPNAKYPDCMFGEDTQTAFGKGWTGATVVFESHPAISKDSRELIDPNAICGTDAFIKPGPWGNAWMSNEGYRWCCTSKEWPGETLAAHLMRAEKLWDHDAFFAYVDRWMTEDNVKWAIELRKIMVAHDMKPEWFENAPNPTYPLLQEMWSKYRNNLPPALGGAPAKKAG